MIANWKMWKRNVGHHHHHHHHHHVVRPARISLTISLHVSLSFIASGRSSGLHPVSSHSCCMYVRAGRPAFDWPYAGVHKSTSLTSSSLLLQQCPACNILVRVSIVLLFLCLYYFYRNLFLFHYLETSLPFCLTICTHTHTGFSRGVMVKAIDCGIVVSEFVLQSRYYVHFQANTLGKGMNPLILPAMG